MSDAEPFDPTPEERRCELCRAFDGTTEYRDCVIARLCDPCHGCVCDECEEP